MKISSYPPRLFAVEGDNSNLRLGITISSSNSLNDKIMAENEYFELRNNFLLLRDSDELDEALQKIVDSYHRWIVKVDESSSLNADENVKECAHTKFVPVIYRLARDCPRLRIREKFGPLLEKLQQWGRISVIAEDNAVCRRVCAYIEEDEIIPVSTRQPEAEKEFYEAFEADGRVSHMTRLLAFHPSFLQKHRMSYNHCMWGEDSSLLEVDRHFMAYMASTRHNCAYLMEITKGIFLDLGGDAEWLKGRDAIPTKMRNLLELNSLMAHQPWMIKPEHIEKLVKAGSDSWSLAEVIHSATILAHFHALTGLVFGCGILPELDMLTAEAAPTAHHESESPLPDEADSTKHEEVDIVKKLQDLGMDESSDDEMEVNQENNMIEFETAEVKGEGDSEEVDQSGLFDARGLPNVDPAVKDHYVQFDSPDLLRMQEFSWPDEGYSTMRRYLPKMAEICDEEFKEIQELTYLKFGSKDVDTAKFRLAIWKYVMRTKGILDDSYKYNEVNVLLDRPLKTFVKSVACYPHRITKRDFNVAMPKELTPSEKVHIVALSFEARKQSELLYVLAATMQYLKSH